MTPRIMYYTCECLSPQHTLRFVYDGNDLYTEVYLNQYRNFFKRIWVAVKYVFGYTSKYGHWDTWILNGNDMERLGSMLEKYKGGNP